MAIDEDAARLGALRTEGVAAIAAAADRVLLDETKLRFLGRKGPLAAIVGTLGRRDPEERKELGRLANETRSALESAVAERAAELEAGDAERRARAERLDVTLPGRRSPLGRLHPITQVIDEIVDVFVGLGFKVADGPEVESDYYAFEALNMPQDHPARSAWDTLYLEPNDYGQPLLRPHTSPVWVRVMEENPPPAYFTMPGRAFRRDVADPTHLAGFHQIDGLAVDKGISFADLKGVVEVFAKALFGSDQRIRMIPHFFPFTEPSAEVHVSCFNCNGKGCRVCGDEGWIEIMGAGMVHPNVFKAVGYEPDVTGFAFGMGIERIAMLRWAIGDIRWLYEDDLRFLEGF
ncbi:MAG TPA: phenylalanine--tRNA ligase subunit alpha [Actinomycetota bacterium]|nr:phenylalanine--tRNA ligase subunit alpha [Actinomycetota bacterium]